MVSKSTSLIMAVAIVAVAAVAIFGVAYAYYASTENSGNTTGTSYLIASQTSYSDGFEDNSVVYSTSNPNGQNVTFEFDNVVDSTGAVVSGTELAAAVNNVAVAGSGGDTVYEIGSSAFVITGYNITTIPAYTLNFKQKAASGTIDTTNFDYYVRVNSDTNYYKITNFATGASINMASPGGATDNVTIHLYIVDKGVTLDPIAYATATSNTPGLVQPLNGVTFVVTASVPQAA